ASQAKNRQVAMGSGDGSFTISVKNSEAVAWTLRVSAAGFAATELTVTPPVTEPLTVRLGVSGVRHEIAVTARRNEAAVNETAEAVTIFGRRELESTGAFTLDDQLRQAAGFN